MKICLINPSNIERAANSSALSSDNKYYVNVKNVPHIGLGYIASYLEQQGFEVDIIECAGMNLSAEEIAKRVEEENYDVVGISIYYFNFKNTVRILSKIIKRVPELFIYAGGYLATMSPELLLRELKVIQCCIIGEGEVTTLELMIKLRDQMSWQDIDGIAYRNGENIVKTKKRALIENLDALPFPKRMIVSERKMVSILSTRGCYGTCTYCGIQEFFQTCSGSKVRRRSPENVLAEIEYLIKEYNPKYIGFNDGNFNISGTIGKDWYHRFSRLIQEKQIKVKFLVDFRANEIVQNEDIITDFIRIGLYNVNIGIESFSQSQLDFYHKRIKVEDNIQAVKMIERLQLKYTYGMLIFDPVITIDEISNILQVVKDIHLYEHYYTVNPPLSLACTVIATKGTELYQYVLTNGLSADNQLNYKFKHLETGLCHQLISQWSQYVAPIYSKHYIVYIAEEHDLIQELHQIKMIYQNLFFFDLDVFTTIANKIQSGLRNNSSLHEILLSYMPGLKKVSDQIDALEKKVAKYY